MRLYVILGAVVTAASLLAGCGSPGALPGTQLQSAPSLLAPAGGSKNVIKNGCFAGLKSWKEIKGTGADKSNPASGSVSNVSGGFGSCKKAVFAGTKKSPAPNGFWGVSQSVKVPSNGKLTWWYKGGSDDMLQYGQQLVNIVSGGKTTACYKKLTTTKNWALGSCSLKSFGGKTVTIEFGVFDNGYSKTYDDWYVSDISLT
ncbi:MAG: hypothetical protein JO302_06215 [Candidatus Eremiobacteraeota bacterium]|nr:hypothetical protein [Candidatus Eremiobacteraeota bacterium]